MTTIPTVRFRQDGHICPPHYLIFEDSRRQESKGRCKFCGFETIQPNQFLKDDYEIVFSERWEEKKPKVR